LKNVFGSAVADDVATSQTPCFAVSPIDAVFENILMCNSQAYLIDTEWVFEGCLPVSFVLFRSLFYFFKVKYVDFGIESFVPIQVVMDRYHLSEDITNCYRQIDDNFQTYVFGKKTYYEYKFQYVKDVKSVPLLEETIQHQREVVKQMHDQITELKDLVDFKQNEVQQVTQLVREKDKMISDIVTSHGWKFVQIVRRLLDIIAPAGTWRRRVVERLSEAFIGLCERAGRLFCCKS